MPEFGPHAKQMSQAGAAADSRLAASAPDGGKESPSYTLRGVVPVGGCIPWMSPVVGAPQPALPTGWEYADGGTISTVGSTMFGFTKPSLMRTIQNPGFQQRFPKGADTTIAYGGATAFVEGGVAAHIHTTQSAGDHNHGATTTAGAHVHTTVSAGDHNHGSSTGFDDTDSAKDYTPGTAEHWQEHHRHSISSGGGHTHVVNSDGDHSHVVPFQAGHAHVVDSTNNEPPFVLMAWIIRVL